MGKFLKDGNRANNNRPNNFQHKKVHGNNFKDQKQGKPAFQQKSSGKSETQGAWKNNNRKPNFQQHRNNQQQANPSHVQKLSDGNRPSAGQNHTKSKSNRGFQRYQEKKNRQNQQKEHGAAGAEEPAKIHYVLHPAKLKRLQETVKDQNMSRREQKQKEYKQAKYKKMTILNQKTSKGQPLMNGRMKLLYEKIQKNHDRENKQQ